MSKDTKDKKGGGKRLLVAIPLFKGHERWLKKCLEYHKDHDLMFIENTINDNTLYIKLLNLQKEYPNIVKVIKHIWEPENTHISYMLGDCWNYSIDYALEHKYDYWQWTAMDIYIEDGGSVEAMVDIMHEFDLDTLGYATNIYDLSGPPSVTKDGSLYFDNKTNRYKPSFYTWDELDEIHERVRFKQVWGTIGVMTCKRRVIEKCKFIYPQCKSWVWGSDLFFITEVNRKGFRNWIDLEHRAINYTDIEPELKTYRKQYEDKWMPK